MVGRVSYLGRVKQGNYHIHVLYTIPNPNFTLPKPYTFIITYPIHHATLGTQTGRVLPCASINTTLPWIPTYPYPFWTKNQLRLSNLSIQHWFKLISILCFFLNKIIWYRLYLLNLRNTLKNGWTDLCRINPGPWIDPFTSHAQINVIEKKKRFLVRKVPLPGSDMSRYPERLLPWFAQNIKQCFVIIRYKECQKN